MRVPLPIRGEDQDEGESRQAARPLAAGPGRGAPRRDAGGGPAGGAPGAPGALRFGGAGRCLAGGGVL